MRNNKEVAEVIAKTVREIERTNNIKDSTIKEICEKNDINEKHIRSVAGWKYDPKKKKYDRNL